jgi:hypothetical protein
MPFYSFAQFLVASVALGLTGYLSLALGSTKVGPKYVSSALIVRLVIGPMWMTSSGSGRYSKHVRFNVCVTWSSNMLLCLVIANFTFKIKSALDVS